MNAINGMVPKLNCLILIACLFVYAYIRVKRISYKCKCVRICQCIVFVTKRDAF